MGNMWTIRNIETSREIAVLAKIEEDVDAFAAREAQDAIFYAINYKKHKNGHKDARRATYARRKTRGK